MLNHAVFGVSVYWQVKVKAITMAMKTIERITIKIAGFYFFYILSAILTAARRENMVSSS